VLLVPLAGLALTGDVRLAATSRHGRTVRGVKSRGLLLFDRGEAGAVERVLVLLARVVREAFVAVSAAAAWDGPWQRFAF
jgi:hypothetical protein